MTWWSFERRWLFVLWETILPSATPEGVALGARDVGLERFLDELLVHAPLRVTFGARACVWLLTFCPLFVIGRFALFPSLGDEERLAVLEKLRSSDVYLVRELPILFKMLGALGYAGSRRCSATWAFDLGATSPPEWAREPER